MGTLAAAAAVIARWASAWTQTPTAHGNVPFDPAAGTPWVRLSVIDGAGQQASVGAPQAVLERHAGVIVVQVFTPSGEGEGRARWLADQAAAVFRRQSFSGVSCRTPSFARLGESGGWFQVNVSIPYWYEQVT